MSLCTFTVVHEPTSTELLSETYTLGDEDAVSELRKGVNVNGVKLEIILTFDPPLRVP